MRKNFPLCNIHTLDLHAIYKEAISTQDTCFIDRASPSVMFEDQVGICLTRVYFFDYLQSDQQGADPQLLTLINLTAVAIRRLIKMSKKISAFKNMCQEDQVALLKGGCTEMMMLRSVMQYDSEASSWKIPHKEETTSLRADILKLARGPVYEEHERFILTFEPKWRQDENIILIMCAIILFTPDRPKTIHSDVIKLEQVRK